MEDYNLFYEKKVAEIVEKVYQNDQHFISAYSTNPTLVFSIIIKKMDVVPYNLKGILAHFYSAMTTAKPDGYKPKG